MATTNGATPERSIGELFGELASETGTLVRQEVQLATTEIGQKAVHAGKQSIMVMAGALLGVVSLMTFAAVIVLVLARWLPLYASALIVATVFGHSHCGPQFKGHIEPGNAWSFLVRFHA